MQIDHKAGATDTVPPSPDIAGLQPLKTIRSRWPAIRQALLDGRYCPSPVRRVLIPKPGGGERALGIPTVKA